MHHVVGKPLRLALLAVLSIILAACSSPSIPKDRSFDYIASVAIAANDSQAQVEAKYGGKAFIFDKDSGIAMLGFSSEEAQLTTLSTETNSNRFSSPVAAQGLAAWAGGWSAWAGGWSAWAGGWSAWAGGTPVAPPVQNTSIWNQINLRQAHTIARNFGAGVTVAVIDSGIDINHLMFSGRLAASNLWRDYVDNDTLPAEGAANGKGYGHGTAVAGLILQVAPKATILPLRVLNAEGRGDLDDVITAIYHAVNSGAKIINLSLGSVDYSASLVTALQYAKNNQVYVVASAGNFGTLNSTTFPARNAYWDGLHPFVLSVGSVNSQNYLSDFTSYGYGLMLNAPGEQNYSAYPGNNIGYFKGTSFAAPIVSGALALAYADANSTARPQLFNALSQSMYNSIDFWSKNEAKFYQGTIGEGIINVANLLRALPGWTEPDSNYTSSTNRFPNPGFESSLSSSWWLNNASRSSLKRSGSWGLEVNAWGYAALTITGLQANTTYTLIGWGRTSQANNLAQIGVANYGGDDFNVSFASTSYATRSMSFKTGPNNTSAHIYFSATDASAYFDDFRLVEDNP